MRPPLDKITFFNYVRRLPFGGKLNTEQVRGLEAIIDAFILLRYTDFRWLAYILATAFHETGGRMQPIREAYGKSTADTIARLDREWAKPGHGALKNVAKPYWREGWFGRGFVQLTWEDNYRKMGQLLGIDLTTDPDKAMEINVAARILIVGMVQGVFRASKDGQRETLERYFGQLVGNPEGARNIVNGKGDKAKLIATYYKAFKDALGAASTLTPQPTDVTPEAAKPDDVPAHKSGAVITIGTMAAGAAGTAAIGAAKEAVTGVSNAWGFAVFALILLFVLVCGGVGLWLTLTGRLTILKGEAVSL